MVDNIDPEDKENAINCLETQLPRFNNLQSYKFSLKGLQAVSSMRFIDRVKSGLNLQRKVSFAANDNEN